MDDPAAWRAANYAGREAEWLAPLTPSDIAELDAAVNAVEADPKLRLEVRPSTHFCQAHFGACREKFQCKRLSSEQKFWWR